MRLRSMDPYDEPAWWRWPVVVELRLITGDFVRAWYWLRRIPYRIRHAVYRRFPSAWPPCPNCGNPRDRLPVLPVGWQLSLHWRATVLSCPVMTWCGECQRAEQRRQAEEFNSDLDRHREEVERLKAAVEFDQLDEFAQEAREVDRILQEAREHSDA